MNSPFFLIKSYALLYSFNTIAFWFGCLAFDKKFVIDDAIEIILYFNAILPAYASLYCLIGERMVEACSFVLKIPSWIVLTTVINYFSIWASGIAPDFILCKIYKAPHSKVGLVSMSFLITAPNALFYLDRWTLNLNKESWKSQCFIFVFSHKESRILKASGFLSES